MYLSIYLSNSLSIYLNVSLSLSRSILCPPALGLPKSQTLTSDSHTNYSAPFWAFKALGFSPLKPDLGILKIRLGSGVYFRTFLISNPTAQ